MPRSDSASNITAAQAQVTADADFLWFVARNRDTGAAVTDGMWSGVGTIDAQVIDPTTGQIVTRTYVGTYGLVSISDIALIAGVSVQPITIVMSQVNARVAQLVRQYDLKQAQVQVHRGRINPASRQMVAPAAKRFVGFVDEIEIVEGAEGEEGGVSVSCVPYSQELLRSNPDTRSHQSQQQRHAGDDFFKDVAVVPDWQQFWGKADGKIGSGAKKGNGLLGKKR
jgi:hypothetical protein